MEKTSRRAVLAGACCGALGATLVRVPAAWAAGGQHTDLSADQALDLLRKGNAAFVADAPFQGAESREPRLEIASGQAPFAVLVGCSDSRVPPELLFGRGLGELFVIRVAGYTVDTTVLGSIEYAVAQLGVPLVVVLGHERCGAVADEVEVVEGNATFPGSIGEMVG